MDGFQMTEIIIQPLLDVDNNILDLMYTRHKTIIWLIFVRIRMP